MSIMKCFVAAGLAIAACGFAAAAARAQTTLISNTGTRAISVSNARVYYSDPTGEFCNSQRSLSIPVTGGTVTEQVVVPFCPFNSAIKADGAYVFAGSLATIVKFWAGGPNAGVTTLASPSIAPEITFYKIDTAGDWVYWQSSSAIGRVGRDGTSPSQIARVTSFRSGMAAASNGYVYWSEGNEGVGVIKRADLSAPVPVVIAGSALNSPAHLATNNTYVFWAETNCVVKRAPLAGGSPITLRSALADGHAIRSLVADASYVYWIESLDAGPGRVMRVPIIGGAPEQVGPSNLSHPNSLQQDVDHVYWIESLSANIRKMPKDAAAIKPDFTWLGLEATQGIQNMANGVPLVSGKPTLVRGYARSTIAGYNTVSATLSGFRTSNGQPLPGSPLRSTVQHMLVPTDSSINDARRMNMAASFSWEIPDSWLNNGITLTANINPSSSVLESNVANNAITIAPPVRSVPPVCLKLRRTRTSVPTYNASGTDFYNIINRYSTLTPARDVWYFPQSGTFEEIDCCSYLPPWVYWGEWEVEQDSDRMIVQLITEETFSLNPSQCNDAGAQTHRVAMVSPDAPTGDKSGYANYVWNVSWVQFNNNGSTGYHYPSGGGTLAQEIAHNHNGWPFYDRWLHVNCGTPDGLNPNYPYATNTIGPPGALNYYGYDFISRAIIRPGNARDYMSYCGPVWVSDYNWRGMMDELGATPLPIGPPPSGNYLMAIGVMNTDTGDAQVLQVYRIPDGMIPTDRLAALLAQQAENTGASPEFRLEAHSSSGAVLQTQNFDIAQASHEHGDEPPVFAILMPDPASTASVLVKRSSDGSTLGSLGASATAPVVSAITSPVAGQLVTNALTISWTASDADNDTLTYIVQYSHDNGDTWEVLAANTPNTTLTVDAMEFLPGSVNVTAPGSSRIRVIASDGFRTGSFTSNPFRVSNRDPIANISLPQHGARFGAGESIRFRGTGYDPEDGRLSSASHSFIWTVNGTPIGTDSDVIFEGGFAPGTYTALLTVRDNLNAPGAHSITFVVVDGASAAPDQDGDGIPDSTDNCPVLANVGQTDTDGDGFGDVCDNCPLVFNVEQADLDGDGFGNECDVQRLYVNIAATGANNGTSWTDAYTSLESALAATDSLPTVTEIWVAQGRYVPTALATPGVPRSATFRLRPNVSIFGGFNGSEHHAEDADPRVQRTIFSGDVLNNDGPNFTNRADNVYTVLTCTASTIIDGLVLTQGNGAGTSPSVAGGVRISASTPTFRRCDFISNQGGSDAGGAVFASFVGSLTFHDCRFLGNWVTGSGGAVRINGWNPQFFNCVFTGNLASGVASRGGAVATFSANPSFVNCTVVANTAGELTGGLHIDGGGAYAGSVVNTIAFLNVDTNGTGTGSLAQIRAHSGSAVTVTRSCVQGGYAGTNISTDPQLVSVAGADGIIGTLDDQPWPAAGSPANDAGANAYALALTIDITGQPRRVDDSGRADTGTGGAPIVDMGAYEFQGAPNCPPDFDNNGLVQVPDIFTFLTAWFANDPAAYNFGGTPGVPAIFAFLTAWFAGCP